VYKEYKDRSQVKEKGMNTESSSTEKLHTVFFEKYNQFAENLLNVFPELEKNIHTTISLSDTDKLNKFKTEVLPLSGNPNRNQTECPNIVLPGVIITNELWVSISDNSKKAIQDYISLLSFCCVIESGDSTWNKEHMDKFLDTWKEKLSSIDFGSLVDKFASMFGMNDSSGSSPGSFFGLSGGMPKLPERFLKGQIAKLAEELVKDFKPEDFGFTPEEIQTLEKEPGKAFEIMMKIYTTKPDIIQKSIHKIANRLKDKVMKGQIRPDEIAREAKELMEEFSENPAFVEIMENFKDMFGFEDMDLARKAGREGSARLAIVRDRLKKKLDAKKNIQVQQKQQQTSQLSPEQIQQFLLEESQQTKNKKKSKK
jgi:hypothetical protein